MIWIPSRISNAASSPINGASVTPLCVAANIKIGTSLGKTKDRVFILRHHAVTQRNALHGKVLCLR
jgi:hypothetical protein